MRFIDGFFQNLVTHGELILHKANGKVIRFGRPDPARPPVTIRLTDAATGFRILANPALGAGEAYMDGRLTVDGDDIRPFIALVAANDRWEDGKSTLTGSRGVRHWLAEQRRRRFHRNHAARSRRNVAHHYDLDDRLYDLFLDRDRQYSCAYFPTPDTSLDEAQQLKKAHIAAKLALAPGQRVLDIGCGWGGMALYLNRVADVGVLGVTLSEEQLRVARRRAEEAGVADRVRFELIDYRALTGRFDRIVSVGMFEHVGVPHYPEFFAKCRDLLVEDGVMLLHTIGRMGKPGVTDAWTDKYIFPGGYAPALSEIMAASEGARLIASDVETLRLHYALTLERWYDRVVAARAEIERIYDARFYRMWTFYLAASAAAFRAGDHCNYQVQYIRERETLPITRGYMGEAEAGLVGKD